MNLRARATFLSEKADLVKTAVFRRFWGVLVQLSSQKQRKHEFSMENPYPRGWSSEKTAMFCRFWGESACVCNFLLRKSGYSENSYVLSILRCICVRVQLSSQKQQTYEFSRENPYPRGWSSEKQLCSDDFEVYLHARATFFSETADLRVLEGESLSEKMI